MDFLKYAVDACEGFLKSVFSVDFWKKAAAAAVLAGFTKAVKSFIETTANVAMGIIRSLFAEKFKKHKYDVSDDDEFDAEIGFSDDCEDDEDFEDDDLAPEDIKHRNLAELTKLHAEKQGGKPNDFIDDISTDAGFSADSNLSAIFGSEEDAIEFEEPINVTPSVRKEDPAWQGAYEVLAEAGCG